VSVLSATAAAVDQSTVVTEADVLAAAGVAVTSNRYVGVGLAPVDDEVPRWTW